MGFLHLNETENRFIDHMSCLFVRGLSLQYPETPDFIHHNKKFAFQLSDQNCETLLVDRRIYIRLICVHLGTRRSLVTIWTVVYLLVKLIKTDKFFLRKIRRGEKPPTQKLKWRQSNAEIRRLHNFYEPHFSIEFLISDLIGQFLRQLKKNFK